MMPTTTVTFIIYTMITLFMYMKKLHKICNDETIFTFTFQFQLQSTDGNIFTLRIIGFGSFGCSLSLIIGRISVISSEKLSTWIKCEFYPCSGRGKIRTTFLYCLVSFIFSLMLGRFCYFSISFKEWYRLHSY